MDGYHAGANIGSMELLYTFEYIPWRQGQNDANFRCIIAAFSSIQHHAPLAAYVRGRAVHFSDNVGWDLILVRILICDPLSSAV